MSMWRPMFMGLFSVFFLLSTIVSSTQSGQVTENAKKELEQLKIEYNQQSFLDNALKGNTNIIDLFFKSRNES